MKIRSVSYSLLAAAATLALCQAAVHADTISGIQTAIASGTSVNVNLTTQGSVDWIAYDGTAGGSAPAGTFQRKNAPFTIAEPTTTSSAFIGYNIGSPVSYSWTDGTPTASGSSTGFFRVNDGSFTFAVKPDGNAQVLTVYAGGTVSVTDTYSLKNSSSPVTLTSPGAGWWYDTIDLQAASTDTLTVTLSGASGKTFMAAATLADAAPTPEPASLGLLSVGGAALLLMARRKRA